MQRQKKPLKHGTGGLTMTQNHLIIFLMFLLLVEVLCMRYFWLRSEAAEEEVKRLKSELDRKDRI